MTFGENLQFLLEERDITQKDLLLAKHRKDNIKMAISKVIHGTGF